MQRLVIACSILFFCASVATASNFTPVKSAQPTKTVLRQKLADEPKCWCMRSKPPPICTFTMPIVRSSLRRVVRLVCLNNCLNNLVIPFQFFRNEHLSGKQMALIDYLRLRRRNTDNIDGALEAVSPTFRAWITAETIWASSVWSSAMLAISVVCRTTPTLSS
jgi:hypothetical protein